MTVKSTVFVGMDICCSASPGSSEKYEVKYFNFTVIKLNQGINQSLKIIFSFLCIHHSYLLRTFNGQGQSVTMKVMFCEIVSVNKIFNRRKNSTCI